MINRHDFERLGNALRAFRKAEGFSLTADQYQALIDQIALACHDRNPDFKYELFNDYTNRA